MFESTLPADAPQLMRVSGFQRYLESSAGTLGGPASTRLSTLEPSVMRDLMRFERDGRASELLEVLAASLRHGRDLLVHVVHKDHVLPLTVFPRARLLHTPLPLADLLALRLDTLAVLQVEPAVLRAPRREDRGEGRGPQADSTQCHALDVLCWEVALRGALGRQLPELAGGAAYRVTPAADLRPLGLTGTLAAAVLRLQRDSTNLRDIAGWPGFDRERAVRLLNGLYLLSALIISRAHPAAAGDTWGLGPRRD